MQKSEKSIISGKKGSVKLIKDGKAAGVSSFAALSIKAPQVKNLQGLQELIQAHVRDLLGFDNMIITLINKTDHTHSAYIYYTREAKTIDDEFTRIKSSAFQVEDGFFNVTLENDFPVMWNVSEVAEWKEPPPYVLYCHANQISQVIGIPIIRKDDRIGIIFFGFKTTDRFQEEDIKYINEIANQISTAIITVKEVEENESIMQAKDLLFQLSALIATVRDKSSLLHAVIPTVKGLLNINGLIIYLSDSPSSMAEPFLLHLDEDSHTRLANILPGEPARAMTDGGIIERVLTSVHPIAWSLSDLMKWQQRPEIITRYRTNNVKKVLGAPIIDKTGRKGVIFFFSADQNAFQNTEFSKIENTVALLYNAVVNIQAYDKIKDTNWEREILISLIKNSVLARDRKQFQDFLKSEFEELNFFEEACIFVINPQTHKLSPLILKQLKDGIFGKEWQLPEAFEFDNTSPFFNTLEHLSEAREFTFTELLKSRDVPIYINHWAERGAKKLAVIPISNGASLIGVLFLIARSDNSFQGKNGLMNGIGSQLSVIVANLIANEKIENQLEEISKYKRQLEIENHYLQQEIHITHNYSEIVGNSPQMREAFHLVSQVAATNSSVLILGETGTGKELIARAIHNASSRRDKVMVKVNCAALPPNLIESELFGHERGSFTGAIDRRIGKFELANNSTIFLDEIGELPLPLQAKLLRALQEKEIERIGGKTTIKIDIRVITATNRDLFKAVQLGTFRGDLYFRLNVFPITLPALRERKEDIPLLANHFAAKYSKRSTKATTHFTSKAMKQLIAYNWPGNVRELEHLIQRSILLSKGKTITQVYLPGVNGGETNQPLQNTDVKTLAEVEREHILLVLKMVNGKVSGVGGAAEVLQIPATTLSSKIKKLKIKKGIS